MSFAAMGASALFAVQIYTMVQKQPPPQLDGKICAIGHVVTYYIDFGSYQSKVKNIHLQEIDITGLADGQYVGEYDAGDIYAKVRVTISHGQIEQIDILHKGHLPPALHI